MFFCEWHDCADCKVPGGIAERTLPQWLQSLKTDSGVMSDVRRLARSCDAGLDFSRMDDNEVIVYLSLLLDRKILRRCGEMKSDDDLLPAAGRGQTQTAADGVIRVLAAGARHISFEGRALRVIRAEQWRLLREDGQYQIVPTAEARQIISRLAAGPVVTPAEKSAWQKTAELLPEHGAGRYSTGLLLLRIVPRKNFTSASAEPAVTPSQLAQMVKHWVEIEMVDEKGVGIAGISYSIIAPDNQEYTGQTDANGRARVDNIPPGQCRISFPGLDKDAYKAA